MYYDPEYTLKLEEDLQFLQNQLEETELRLGEDDPWTKRICLLRDIFQSIVHKENDLANCWDELECEILSNQIDELIDIAKQVLRT